MGDFVKNFVVAFVTIAGALGTVIGALYGMLSFFYWLSAGEAWGLPCAIVGCIAVVGATVFATLQAANP